MKLFTTMEQNRFLTFACIVVFTATTAAAQTRQISSSGTGSFSESSLGVDIGNGPELDSALSAVEHDSGNHASGGVQINRRIDHHPKGLGVNISGKSHAKSNPVVE
jgi:hypothetical protein